MVAASGCRDTPGAAVPDGAEAGAEGARSEATSVFRTLSRNASTVSSEGREA